MAVGVCVVTSIYISTFYVAYNICEAIKHMRESMES